MLGVVPGGGQKVWLVQRCARWLPRGADCGRRRWGGLPARLVPGGTAPMAVPRLLAREVLARGADGRVAAALPELSGGSRGTCGARQPGLVAPGRR